MKRNPPPTPPEGRVVRDVLSIEDTVVSTDILITDNKVFSMIDRFSIFYISKSIQTPLPRGGVGGGFKH
jgi:hypothetical protein